MRIFLSSRAYVSSKICDHIIIKFLNSKKAPVRATITVDILTNFRLTIGSDHMQSGKNEMFAGLRFFPHFTPVALSNSNSNSNSN